MCHCQQLPRTPALPGSGQESWEYLCARGAPSAGGKSAVAPPAWFGEPGDKSLSPSMPLLCCVTSVQEEPLALIVGAEEPLPCRAGLRGIWGALVHQEWMQRDVSEDPKAVHAGHAEHPQSSDTSLASSRAVAVSSAPCRGSAKFSWPESDLWSKTSLNDGGSLL